MNKYLKAVGLCVGLTAVILISGINAFLMTESEWLAELNAPRVPKMIFTVGWLVSYTLFAFTIGEFCVTKPLRKFLYLPFLNGITTVGIFACFFRGNNVILTTVSAFLSVALLCVMLCVTLKRAKTFWQCAFVNIIWYFFVGCTCISLCVMN